MKYFLLEKMQVQKEGSIKLDSLSTVYLFCDVRMLLNIGKALSSITI